MDGLPNFGARIPMSQLIDASYALDVSLEPGHQGDPHLAALRNPAGELVGHARQCFACAEWVNAFDPEYLGAANDALGFWLCRRCFIQKRHLTIAPTRGILFAAPEIPPEYIDASINDLPKPLRAKARSWPAKVALMVVSAPSRAGKTRLTWAYVKAAAQADPPRRITRVFLPQAQKTWQNFEHGHEREALERNWQQATCLIMDDLSACDPTGPWIRMLHVLIDVRLREGNPKPTLFTTATGAAGLGQVYGDAVHKRLTAPSVEWLILPERKANLLGETK